MTPLTEPRSCTEADWSPGALGSLVSTATVRLAPGARVNEDGTTVPSVVNRCSRAFQTKVPLNALPVDNAISAVQVPAAGYRTSDIA